jgi:hypothetical protein
MPIPVLPRRVSRCFDYAVGLLLLFVAVWMCARLQGLDLGQQVRSALHFYKQSGSGFMEPLPIPMWNDSEGRPLPDWFPGQGLAPPEEGLRYTGAMEDRALEVDWESNIDSPLHFELPSKSPSTRRGAAFPSEPSEYTDLWGRSWILVVIYQDQGQRHDLEHVLVFSSGADGRFEWGAGDDFVVYPDQLYFAFQPKTTLAIAAVVAAFIFFPYLALRLLLSPRSERQRVEALRAALIALPPGALLATVQVPLWQQLAVSVGPKVVPAWAAVALTLYGLVGGCVFAARLKWAVKSGPETEPDPTKGGEAEPAAPAI